MGIGNALGRAGRAALCLALAAGLAPAVAVTAGAGTAEATEIEANGTTWDTIGVYSIPDPDDNSVKELSGVWAVYKGGGEGDVTVPATVEWGGKTVPVVEVTGFSGCTQITSVTLPETVEKISLSAFSGCTSLRSVRGASGVKIVYKSAFEGCTSLASIDLDPENVEYIGQKALEGCPYTFESPYLEDAHDGTRSLAVEARARGCLYKEAAVEAVKYLNKLRKEKGLGELTIDASVMEYAERQAMRQTILQQSHLNDGLVDDDQVLTDGYGHYDVPSYESAGTTFVSRDKEKADSAAIGKKAVDLSLRDPAHWAICFTKDSVYVGVGIFQQDVGCGGVVIDFLTDSNKNWVVKEAEKNVPKVEAVDETAKICVSSIHYDTLCSQFDHYDFYQECTTLEMIDSRSEVDNKPKLWNRIDYDAWLLGGEIFEVKGARWSISDESVAKIASQSENRCSVKLLKPGTYTLACTIPTTKGKVLTLSWDHISDKQTYTPVTYTDGNGTVYTQIEKGKRTLAATGLTTAAKARKTASVALPSGVTIDGRKWTVKAIAKGFLKGSAATKLKVYDPYVSVAKGVLKGTKVETVRLAHAKGWHYKENFGPDAAKKIRKAELKELKQSFAKKRCGKKVKVTACKR